MKKKHIKKINIKSNSGFTMADLVAAMAIITIFTGIIGSLLYSSFKLNMQVKMSSVAINYAIQILEDVDKITYEEVKNGMESSYVSKFSIPSGFNLSMDVSNYKEVDIVKKVKLTITYEFLGNTENVVIQKIKVKEI